MPGMGRNLDADGDDVMTNSSDPVCRRVIYHGQVQGVGFRATTARIARSYAVSGFVKNLSDGTVELVVHGAPQEINRFLADVARQFAGYIDRVEEASAPHDIVEKGFTIRY